MFRVAQNAQSFQSKWKSSLAEIEKFTKLLRVSKANGNRRYLKYEAQRCRPWRVSATGAAPKNSYRLGSVKKIFNRLFARAILVVGSRRFNGAPPVAAKTRFKPTFMVSRQTLPQTHFGRGLAKRHECRQMFDLSTFMLMFAAFRSF